MFNTSTFSNDLKQKNRNLLANSLCQGCVHEKRGKGRGGAVEL